MALRTIVIKTCRKCGKSFYVGDRNCTLRPDDELDIVDSFTKCWDCTVNEDRQMKSRKKRHES